MLLCGTEVLAQVPTETAPDQVQGTLTVVIEDYFAQHRAVTRYFVRDQAGRDIELSFRHEPVEALTPGALVRSRGKMKGESFEVSEFHLVESTQLAEKAARISPSVTGIPGLPAITPSSGVQKTLVFNLVSAVAGSETPRFSNGQLRQIMFAATGLSVNTLYLESSFNTVSFSGDIIGPYKVTDPTTCDVPSITSQAVQAAKTAGIDSSSYSHLIYMLPSDMIKYCTFGGTSTLGGTPSVEWINTGAFGPADTNVFPALTHELGHGLKMAHAQAIAADGSFSEYGDDSCLMGNGGYRIIEYNVVHRIQEGWIPLSNVLQVSAPGTYTVNFAETQSNQVLALQITTPGSTGNMFISYRQPIGQDANLPSAFLGAASITYWKGGSNKSQLATNYPWGGALSDNQKFNSPDGTVAIRQISHTDTSVMVEVSTYTNASVSAASNLGGFLTPEIISTVYGTGLATGTASAQELPLPTNLLGTSVQVIDILGTARLAPLYFVSPTQVNYEMPAGTAVGVSEVDVTSGTGAVSTGAIQIAPVSPGLFLLNDAELAAGAILRVKANGAQTTEAIFKQDASGVLVPLPVDMSDPSDQLYLTLYGTGLRAAGTSGIKVNIAGFAAPVTYAGPQGSLVGLDQVNVRLPQSLAGAGIAPIFLSANGLSANPAAISIAGKPSPPTVATNPIILAQDNFNVPPYILGDLSGQPVGGTGFTGTWLGILGQGLTVTGPGLVGRPAVTAQNSGECATFAPALNFGGQLFISMNVANQLSANLSSSRLQLNFNTTPAGVVYLGGLGLHSNFNLTVDNGAGSSVTAQTALASTGSHRIVGVLDPIGDQIAIFVDPTEKSFYTSANANNADAVAHWVPPPTLSFNSYCLIENLSDQVTFSHIAFSTNSKRIH